MKKNNNYTDNNNTMDDEDEKLIERWFDLKNVSSGTQINYRIGFRYYVELTGKTPSELLQEAEKEEAGNIIPRKRSINDYLIKYKKFLMNKVAPATVNLYFYSVRSFYRAFDINLPDIKVPTGDIGLEENQGKLLTRKEIHKLISVSSPREKALIYLMALSGMGQREARSITIKQFLRFVSSAIGKELDDVYDLFRFEDESLSEVVVIEITRSKSTIRHHACIPPEATREIITYLKERCYGRNKKIRIKTINDTIFVNIYGKRLSRDSIVTNFRNMGEKAGFKRDKNAYSFWRAHALRKYYISTIMNKLGKKDFADYTTGHKISEQDRAYWKVSPEDLKNTYLEALPFLSLDKAKVRDINTNEFEEYKEKFKEKDDVVSSLVQQIDEMKKQNLARDEFLDKIMSNHKVVEELEELDKLNK